MMISMCYNIIGCLLVLRTDPISIIPVYFLTSKQFVDLHLVSVRGAWFPRSDKIMYMQ